MPGERTSWDTTTRSVPLMMNVPLSVITGKSPMKTVWLLISPVVLFVNSAVTNSGAAYVMSLSLHSSTEALTSSKRGSEKDSDMEPEKSSIGEISVRISSRPPTGFSSPASMRRWNHASSPTSHSNDWVCRSSRSGTRKGSRIFAKETRVGAPGRARWSEVVAGVVVARDEAKMRPSENYALVWRALAPRATLGVSPGRGTRAVGARVCGNLVLAVCCRHAAAGQVSEHESGHSTGEGPLHTRANLEEGSAKRQSSCKRSRCREGSLE